ncbi:MAG: hypothetical protein PVF58_11030 [Candidatus Methanofastidiosia archaeon]|jgi:hypothetical protein
MPYIVLNTKTESLEKVGPSLYYCSRDVLKEYPHGFWFKKKRVKKFRLQQRTKQVGYILLWYKIADDKQKNRKVINRMMEKSLGFPLNKWLYAFPYVHYTNDMPFLPPHKIYARGKQLGIKISKKSVLTPLGKTQKRITEKAEHYIRSKYEQLIRRVLHASYTRRNRSELRLTYKKLKQKGRVLSVVLGINVNKLERKAYRYILKWEKRGQT